MGCTGPAFLDLPFPLTSQLLECGFFVGFTAPISLQCFGAGDVELLKEVAEEMPEEERFSMLLVVGGMKFLSTFRREKHLPKVYCSFRLVDWYTFPIMIAISDGFLN